MGFKLDVEEYGIDKTTSRTLSNRRIIEEFYTEKKNDA